MFGAGLFDIIVKHSTPPPGKRRTSSNQYILLFLFVFCCCSLLFVVGRRLVVTQSNRGHCCCDERGSVWVVSTSACARYSKGSTDSAAIFKRYNGSTCERSTKFISNGLYNGIKTVRLFWIVRLSWQEIWILELCGVIFRNPFDLSCNVTLIDLYPSLVYSR